MFYPALAYRHSAAAIPGGLPDLSIDLRLSDHFIDLVTEGGDPALRIGTLDALSLIRQRLGAMSRPIVASPDLTRVAG